MAEIITTNGHRVLVDDEDYEWLDRYEWRARRFDRNRTWYAYGYDPVAQKAFSMHRLLLEAKRGEQVDHANGNGLDNRKDNLRIATPTQNAANVRAGRKNTSGYKGVSFHRRTQKWVAQITVGRKTKSLGYFHTKEEAAEAYNVAAAQAFGEFAKLNHTGEVADFAPVVQAMEFTDKEAKAVELHAGQGLAYDEVAVAMGISLADVRVLMDEVKAKVVRFQECGETVKDVLCPEKAVFYQEKGKRRAGKISVCLRSG